MRTARYDGHADWYDTMFRHYAEHSAELLADLLGPPDPANPVCVDVGCGTGLHTAAVRARGHAVLGIDLSADQLRIAATRNPLVVRADATRLPLPDHSVGSVTMTFTHTDMDEFPAAVGEAARVLRPGGRLVYIGLHPAYVGAFVFRQEETHDHTLTFTAGYGDERLRVDPTGRFPVRSRVGARNLTLTTFLGAFLGQRTLRLTGVTELDTAMRPWRPDSTDGRIVPWHIALTAVAGRA